MSLIKKPVSPQTKIFKKFQNNFSLEISYVISIDICKFSLVKVSIGPVTEEILNVDSKVFFSSNPPSCLMNSTLKVCKVSEVI